MKTINLQESKKYLSSLNENGGPELRDFQTLDNFFFAIDENIRENRITKEELAQLNTCFDFDKMPDSFHSMCVQKPFGYAGDFLVIDKIYTYHTCENYSKWDQYFHTQSATKAVRNRKDYFKESVKNFLHEKNDPAEIRLLNIASGPCRDLLELYEDETIQTNILTTCVEMDAHAIDYSKKMVKTHAGKINFIQKNILRFNCDEKFDIIWSAGLFDYFNDAVFVRLLKRMKNWLKPNGRIVIGNFNQEHNPSRTYMEVMGEWFLEHRSEGHLLELAQKAGFNNSTISVEREQENVNLFLNIWY